MNDECLSGHVESIIFSSEETGFAVATLKVAAQGELFTIIGTLPALQPGEMITCIGTWKRHPKFGQQFAVTSYETKIPSTLRGIQKYLESGLIRGIGPVYAERIVMQFGKETLEIIDQFPMRLKEVEGIGPKRVDSIIESWGAQKAIRSVMIFLQTYGIRPSLAHKVYKVYGEKSLSILKENPYLLAKTLFGVGFKSADEIANKVGIPKTSELRLAAGVEHVLSELASEGHTCCSQQTLLAKSEALLGYPAEIGLNALHLKGDLILAPIGEEIFSWLKGLYFAEVGIAREISRLLSGKGTLRAVDIAKALDWVEKQIHLTLAPEQKEAICLALKEKVLIITGGPGTGKSTITRAILAITEKLTTEIFLAAPTGRAAKRMSEITRRKAQTIHSLLEVDFVHGGFKRGKEHPITADLIIVDEASMIDTSLMHNLLQALPSSARLIFLGDIDQLPSVGPGTVLRDLIGSGKVPTITLKRIFRQARGSKIVTNAHRINAGFFPDLESEQEDDFSFIEKEDPQEIATLIVQLVSKDLPKMHGFDPFEGIQVLSPMKRGILGTENLNALLQTAINPSEQSLMKMGKHFHVHDKVMQIRNDYQKLVFNGDIGYIRKIHLEEQVMVIAFDGREIEYAFADLDDIMLAYAVSVHKYQGSECPCIVLPIHTQHFKLLERNLLYTGITRGKKRVVLIGTKKALALAINNTSSPKRITALPYLLGKIA